MPCNRHSAFEVGGAAWRKTSSRPRAGCLSLAELQLSVRRPLRCPVFRACEHRARRPSRIAGHFAKLPCYLQFRAYALPMIKGQLQAPDAPMNQNGPWTTQSTPSS